MIVRSAVASSLERARAALSDSVAGLAERTQDVERIGRISVVTRQLTPSVAGALRSLQRSDGGWICVNDSLWALAALLAEGEGPDVTRGLEWLSAQRSGTGGWGLCNRDSGKVPTTSLVLHLLGPMLATQDDWRALEGLWAAELASAVRLTYKGGFYLLATGGTANNLADETLAFLTKSANDDGGFGPWPGHPIGSDPWSTGVCLAGACAHPSTEMSLVLGAMDWLLARQLPSGYWPCHFIDEGTAYAYWGLSAAVRFLEAS